MINGSHPSECESTRTNPGAARRPRKASSVPAVLPVLPALPAVPGPGPWTGPLRSAEFEHAGVENLTLLKRGTDRAVQSVLQVEVALPLHDVREQVAVERRILGEEGFEIQVALGGHQLIEADRARRDIR